MKKSIFLLLCCFSCSLIIGQNHGQFIQKKRHYYLNDKIVGNEKLVYILSTDSACIGSLNKSKMYSDIGSGFALVGGSLAIGSSLYLVLSSGQGHVSWTPVTVSLIGLGFVLGSIPFAIISNTHLKKTIEIYNSKTSADINSINKIELNFGATSNGVGVVCRF